MNRILLFLCALSFSSCSSQTRSINSSQFNDDARIFFIDHFDSLNLSPLTENEKCNLREAIAHDLDSLDDFAFYILSDRYLIKTYFEPYLEIRFSIVKDLKNGVFYFLCFPHFYQILYDARMYYEDKGSKYELKIPREVIKVNASLYQDFIEMHGSDNGRVKLSRQLIRATMPEFPAGGNIAVSEFKTKMQREYDVGLIPESSIKELLEIVDSSGYGNQEIVFIEQLGYLILVFDETEDNVQFYFLPELERASLFRSHHFTKYRNCD